jgi:hypothetical protein
VLEHDVGGDAGQPLDLVHEPLAVVHGAGMAGFVDQDAQRLGAQRVLPEAVDIDRQRQDAGAVPAGTVTIAESSAPARYTPCQ